MIERSDLHGDSERGSKRGPDSERDPDSSVSTRRIVAIFISLKVRLLTNGFKSSPTRAVLVSFGALVGIAVGAAGMWTVAQQRYDPTSSELVVIVLFSIAFAGWLVVPLIAFGTDDTLDPAKLRLLPIRPGQMLAGMGVAAIVGIPAIVTTVILLGTLPGYAPHDAAALLTLVAVIVEVAMCIVGSRAVVTAMAALLRSRRGRDIGVIALSVIGTSFFFFRALLARSAGSLGAIAGKTPDARLRTNAVVDFLRWTPPGFAAHAVIDAQHGHLVECGTELLIAACFVGVLALWWRASLSRSLVSNDRSASSARVRPGATVALFPRIAAWCLPNNHTGAVAAREFLYASRDARRRTMWIQSAVLGLVVPLGTPAIAHTSTPKIVFAAAMVPLLICLNSLNSFGLDGPALWIDIANSSGAGSPHGDSSDAQSPDKERGSMMALLTGKNVAQAALALLMGVPVTLILAALENGWPYVPMVLAAIVCTSGVVMGIGNVSSVVAPIPIPDNPGNAFATAGGGRGCATALVQMAAILGVGLAMLPVGALTIAALDSGSHAYEAAVSLVTLAYGVTAWRLGTVAATRLLRGREPELLAAVSQNQLS